MDIAERLNFNNKVMDFCLRTVGWTQRGPQEEYLESYSGCLNRAILAEQLFRAEISRPRPGLPIATEEEE
jgi:hypothetical protein